MVDRPESFARACFGEKWHVDVVGYLGRSFTDRSACCHIHNGMEWLHGELKLSQQQPVAGGSEITSTFKNSARIQRGRHGTVSTGTTVPFL